MKRVQILCGGSDLIELSTVIVTYMINTAGYKPAKDLAKNNHESEVGLTHHYCSTIVL